MLLDFTILPFHHFDVNCHFKPQFPQPYMYHLSVECLRSVHVLIEAGFAFFCKNWTCTVTCINSSLLVFLDTNPNPNLGKFTITRTYSTIN